MPSRTLQTTEGLLAQPDRTPHLLAEAASLATWDLDDRQIWDTELLLNGGFAPLDGFLGKRDHEKVCQSMRRHDGALWPIPINLDVTEEFAKDLGPGDRIALRHPEGLVLAIMTLSDVWRPDRAADAQAVFGTTDDTHPGVFEMLHANPVYLGGRLEGVELPVHHTFRHLRHTPARLKAHFAELGVEKVVAFQTRNPLHRAHVELTKRAAAKVGGHLLLHPVVGRTKPGDVNHFTRVRCYEAVLPRYPPGTATLSLLPLAMRMGGPREALWHAIIRRNYGATHFVVGRDHAGPGAGKDGKPFYGPYEAHELIQRHADEVGIEAITFENMVYVQEGDAYYGESEVPDGATVLNLSGTELRQRLRAGQPIPEWFTFPDVAAHLRRQYKPRPQQGLTVFFTGLSGAGKSTIANILVAKLMEEGSRPVTLLDGDLVRKHLSSELGFSKEHRDINIKRIGYVASEITKNGGVAVCAPIAPYQATRRQVRDMIEDVGGFVLVHVDTPLDVCEDRDRKGLYAKARAGLLKEFTGVSDPYEEPSDAELRIDTTQVNAEGAAALVVQWLEEEGYLVAPKKEEKLVRR